MYCPKCGDPVENNEKYCNKCGNYLVNDLNQNTYNLNQNQPSNNVINNTPQNQFNEQLVKTGSNKKAIFIGLGIGLGILVVIICVFVFGSKNNYYFSDSKPEKDITSGNSNTKKGKYSTVIVTDNVYNGVNISNSKDAYDLIVKDSVSQKDKCPKEIRDVENEFIEKYDISAVNLCEMDVDFARELENVFEVIYREYPFARGKITNLSLINTNMRDSGTIAMFMPIFNFATSDSESSYPWVIKTQVFLSSQFFLNKEKLEMSTRDGSAAGHFPPNSTVYSPLAHELGHYLSFLAMMNYYKINSILLIDNNNSNSLYKMIEDFGEGNYSLSMIEEAYENYKKDTNTTLSLDEWRGTISGYALAKRENGDYIYDETIAESFHDVYLNKDNASDASKYIIKVLKGKLGG